MEHELKPRTMPTRTAGALIAAALTLGVIVGALTGQNTERCAPDHRGRVCIVDTGTGPRAEHHPNPEEDEPGWDCATMGNRRCQP